MTVANFFLRQRKRSRLKQSSFAALHSLPLVILRAWSKQYFSMEFATEGKSAPEGARGGSLVPFSNFMKSSCCRSVSSSRCCRMSSGPSSRRTPFSITFFNSRTLPFHSNAFKIDSAWGAMPVKFLLRFLVLVWHILRNYPDLFLGTLQINYLEL